MRGYLLHSSSCLPYELIQSNRDQVQRLKLTHPWIIVKFIENLFKNLLILLSPWYHPPISLSLNFPCSKDSLIRDGVWYQTNGVKGDVIVWFLIGCDEIIEAAKLLVILETVKWGTMTPVRSVSEINKGRKAHDYKLIYSPIEWKMSLSFVISGKHILL